MKKRKLVQHKTSLLEETDEEKTKAHKPALSLMKNPSPRKQKELTKEEVPKTVVILDSDEEHEIQSSPVTPKKTPTPQQTEAQKDRTCEVKETLKQSPSPKKTTTILPTNQYSSSSSDTHSKQSTSSSLRATSTPAIRTAQATTTTPTKSDTSDSTTKQSQGSINSLPDELLVEIFLFLNLSDLTSASQVQRRWKRLRFERRNFLDFSIYGDALQESQVLFFFVHCKRVESLDFSGCINMDNLILSNVSDSFFGTLRKLNLEGCEKITNYSFISLFQRCTLLEEVNLYMCHIKDDGLEALGKNCAQLRSLDISKCSKIQDEGFGHIGKSMQQLKMLTIGGQKFVTEKGLLRLTGCASLERLSIHTMEVVNDQVMKVFAEKMPNLIGIDLYLCPNVSDTSLAHFSDHCKQLRDLNLWSCKLSDSGLMKLTQGCPGLQKLKIRDCTTKITKEGIQMISQMAPKLKNRTKINPRGLWLSTLAMVEG
eukprot:TRINITY_DN3044_c0_g1_i1.p1 TRINITY_DN3044_c0_g1~~TRINITY_DN3044_c0_g1_i1.p1  ORF type:complete len:483 (-),score=102.11 TRINITY_DN3044_c0_g1_i1:167-1615(-)